MKGTRYKKRPLLRGVAANNLIHHPRRCNQQNLHQRRQRRASATTSLRKELECLFPSSFSMAPSWPIFKVLGISHILLKALPNSLSFENAQNVRIYSPEQSTVDKSDIEYPQHSDIAYQQSLEAYTVIWIKTVQYSKSQFFCRGFQLSLNCCVSHHSWER
jgi:hypothetical protein